MTEPAPPHPTLPRRRWPTIAAVSLIAMHLLLGLWTARQTSVTFDEFAHLPAGIAYWRAHAMDIYNLSPPLPRLWLALPAAVDADVVMPETGNVLSQPAGERHWTFGRAFLRANSDAYHATFLGGRLMATLLSCVGAFVVFIWTQSLAGPAAGVAACALYVACPNLIAHGSIVGTDSPAAITLLIAAFTLDRYVRGPSQWRGATMVLAVAVLPSIKFSLLPAWAITAGLLGGFVWTGRLHRGQAFWPLVALPLVGLALCWLPYLGLPGGQSIGEIGATRSRLFLWLDGNGLGEIARLFPKAVVEGFDVQLDESAGRYSGFLFGNRYQGAAWGYYPTAILSKWTLGLLLLTLTSAIVGLRRCQRIAIVPTAFAVGYALSFSLLTEINIGSRYLLPMLPLIQVAVIATLWRADLKKLRLATVALVALASVEGLASMPNPLGFYNIAARATGIAGREFVDDDWGQSLIALRQWMTANDVDRVRLASFGQVDPEVYGIAFDEVDDPDSRAAWFACSAAMGTGNPLLVARPGGGVRWIVPPPGVARRIRDGDVDVRIGAICLFRVDP